MKKNRFLIFLILNSIYLFSYAAEEMDAYNTENIRRYCERVSGLSQSTVDGISQHLSIDSRSIQFRTAFNFFDKECHITVDTSVGPQCLTALKFYRDKSDVWASGAYFVMSPGACYRG